MSVSGREYAVETDSNGKKYWHIETEKDIFKNLKTVKELQTAAYNYILRGEKGSEVIDIIDGEKLKFIRISAGEYVYGEDFKTLNTEQYKQKMRMSTSVIDLIRNATIKYDAPDHKNHKMFRAGFRNYQGRVGIDETIFKYIVRVEKAQYGKIFYDICLEVDGKVPRAKRTSLIKPSTSKGSISQPIEKSNTSGEKTSENTSGREFALDIESENVKLRAEWEGDRVFSEEEIEERLYKKIDQFKYLKKNVKNEIIHDLWVGLNESRSAEERKTAEIVATNKIVEAITLNPGSEFGLTEASDRQQLTEKVIKVVSGIATKSYKLSERVKLEKTFAQQAKTKANAEKREAIAKKKAELTEKAKAEISQEKEKVNARAEKTIEREQKKIETERSKMRADYGSAGK